ncbi:MAG: hypothetical protein K6B15_05790 [Parasporobacterium sp.]|nr:hypothetical protein [Parasporobacterium sp.]
MKKKILSMFLAVTLLLTLIPSTVMAAGTPATARDVKAVMETIADGFALREYNYYINEDLSNSEIVQWSSQSVFIINRSGTESENISKLNELFLDSLDDTLKQNGKITTDFGDESINTYCDVIIALLALGYNPENYNGYNIVELLSNAVPYIMRVSHPYISSEYYASVYAVANQYKDSYPNIANCYNDLDRYIMSNYIKNKTVSTERHLDDENYQKYCGSFLEDNYTLNEDYFFSEYGSLYLSSEKSTEIVNALNNNIHFDNGIAFSISKGTQDFLILAKTVTGPTFAFSGDQNDASFYMNCILGLYASPNPNKSCDTSEYDDPAATATVSEAITGTLSTAEASITENNYMCDKYGKETLADTAVGLMASSVYGRSDMANKLYNGLMSLYHGGAEFIDVSGGTDDYNELCLKALYGIVSYYYMLSGNGNIFHTGVTALNTGENTPVEINTPETTYYAEGSGNWFTISSPLPLSELLDIMIDGKSVFGEYISTDENGVMTYAAVGGGSIRVWEGSTYVSFSPEFMVTLDNGEHTVRIQSTTGFSELTFTVTAPTPSTADINHIGLYVTLACLAAGIALVAAKRKISKI